MWFRDLCIAILERPLKLLYVEKKIKWRKRKRMSPFNQSYNVILHLSTSSLMRVKLNHFSSMFSNAWHLLHEQIGDNRRPWCSMIQRRSQIIKRKSSQVWMTCHPRSLILYRRIYFKDFWEIVLLYIDKIYNCKIFRFILDLWILGHWTVWEKKEVVFLLF